MTIESLARRPFLGAACGLLLAAMLPAQAAPQETDPRPFVVEAYYKARWGSAGEFLRLFRKNHLPILNRQMEEGRILGLKAESPFYHSAEEGRWDLRVTITWKNSVVAHDDYDGGALVRKLFPDEALFKAEEQRRFELLLSHWDVVLTPVELGPP